MSVLGTAIPIGVAALAIWIVLHNVRGRRRERLHREERGTQTASDFALLFETPSERFVAEKIYPYLQMATFSRQFSFRKDDLLWERPLNFVKDDVEDNLRSGFWDELDLGLSAESPDFATAIFSKTKTVGELVCAISSIHKSKYGSVRGCSK